MSPVPLPALFRSAALALAATLPLLCPAFEWNGSAGSDFASTASWTGPVPVAGAINGGELYVINGTAAPLVYSAAQGVTRFDCADFKIGNSNQPGGAMLMTGGELSVTTLWAPMIAHNNNQTGMLTLSGGRLTFASRPKSKPDERSFRVGNWRGTRTRGILNVSGGVLVLDTPGDAALGLGGLVIACSDAAGEVNLTGGLLVVSSPHGTSFQPAGGRGAGVLTLGLGDGVFMQTDSKQIGFGAGGGERSYINFLDGSRGQISLAGATLADFERWVWDGKIRVDGAKVSPAKFRFHSIEGQGAYMLAPVR